MSWDPQPVSSSMAGGCRGVGGDLTLPYPQT